MQVYNIDNEVTIETTCLVNRKPFKILILLNRESFDKLNERICRLIFILSLDGSNKLIFIIFILFFIFKLINLIIFMGFMK